MTKCLPINSCSECRYMSWAYGKMKWECLNSKHPHMLADIKTVIDLTKEISPECPLDIVSPKKGLPPPTEGQHFKDL